VPLTVVPEVGGDRPFEASGEAFAFDSRLLDEIFTSLRPSARKAEAEARAMAQKISQLLTADDRRQTTLIGPAPCFFARVGGLYRWQVILRGPDPESLGRGLKLDGWRVEVEPLSLL
jgi:hypothetical protein